MSNREDRIDVHERELREEFDALRRDAGRSGRVPDFDAMMARAKDEVVSRPALEVVAGGAARSSDAAKPGSDERTGDGVRARRRVVRIGGWVSLATAAVAAGLLLVQNPTRGLDADAEFERLVAAYSADAAAGAWRSPTDGLLDMPGLDLGAVPSVGGSLRDTNSNDAPAPDGPEGRDL